MSELNFQPLVPGEGPLAGAVEMVFLLEGYSPKHRFERVVPNGRATLVIELDGRPRTVRTGERDRPPQECRGSWLSGVQSEYLMIGEVGPETRLCAVQFAPGRALPFVHASMETFNDRVVPGSEVFGGSIEVLREELVGEEDGEPLLSKLTGWLEARHEPESAAPGVVEACVEALSEPGAQVALTSFVEGYGGVSYKHFVHLFKTHVGPTPKRMQRILRFAQAFETLQREERVDWSRLSLELGYADQSHFIRDFRAFSGYRPQTFLEEGHERLNFFPDDPPGE